MGFFKDAIINLISRNKIEPTANVRYWSGQNMIAVGYDGEKTPYELGTPLDYKLNYQALRARSWQAFLDTDIVQNAIKKYCLWLIGPGLKLQSDPIEKVLENNKITNEDLKEFVENVESSFRLYAKIRQSTHNENQSLHALGAEALKSAILAGDILCINRFDGEKTTLETIDGYYVQSPFMDSKHFENAENAGNKIIEGVEIDRKGTHIAYYIRQENFNDFKRISARSKDGKTLYAWLFYGMKYKPQDIRGVTLLAAVLETVAKIDRYKDATLGAAEENAKIPYTIEHSKDSDGENPMINQLAQSLGKGAGTAPETDGGCDQLATKVAQTTSKQTYNMPIGSTLKRNSGESDINFPDFFHANVEIVYATIGIPPEVALDRYSEAYSGSRAALKSWEYKILTDRETSLKDQFYKPFYDFYLDIQVLSNKLQAPGYLQALSDGNFMVLEAYRNCRFIGATVPHIDPLKEVNAERKKLGDKFKDTPLTSVEQSCEALNTGDFTAVIKKAETEKQLSDDAGFIEEEPIIVETETNKNPK